MKGAPSCIYLPTCSEYAMEAVKTRGIIVGTVLAVARLLRCNPLFHGGYHPVPRAHDCAHHHATSHGTLGVRSGRGPADTFPPRAQEQH